MFAAINDNRKQFHGQVTIGTLPGSCIYMCHL